jgi:uncharacterized protein
MGRPSALARLDTALLRIVVAAIRAYQKLVPDRRKRHCLMEPHCSEYARLAVIKYGVLVGASKSWARIRRCRPGNLLCWTRPNAANTDQHSKRE